MAKGQLFGGKTPPFSEEAERAVLGAVINQSRNLDIIESLIETKHFYINTHKKIYEAILDLSEKGKNVDIVTLGENIRHMGGQQDFGAPYLVELTENSPVSLNVEHYAEIVRNHYYRRSIISTCSDVIQNAMSFEGQIEGFIEDVEKQFLTISSEYDKSGIQLADAVLESTIDTIQRKLEHGDQEGVKTGFVDLDALTGGFQRSDLIILAARPGMGKTALALNVATYAAFTNKSIVIFTLEMSKEQLMMRILSSVSQVDSSRLRKGDLTDEEQDRLMEGARRVYEGKAPMGIDETPSISLVELRSRCRRFKREKGLDFIVIDYLQLMSASANRKYDSREREISEISRGLKALAKELDVPILALAQLNRSPDARPDKRPKLSDLRESGSMEQDADLILFVYRDEYYNPNSELAGISEVIVGKNRHGGTTTVKLAFQPNFVAFQNLFDGE